MGPCCSEGGARGQAGAEMRIIELLFIRELPVAPEVLWPWVSASAHISQWASVQISPLTPGPGGAPDQAGATRQVRMGALVMEERLIEVVAPERLVYSVYQGGAVRWHQATVVLAPTVSGTRLSWTVAAQPAVPGTGWIIRRTLTRQFEADLDALAVLVRAEASQPEPPSE